MSNEENTKDRTVEELAEALAEGMKEDVTDEVTSVEAETVIEVEENPETETVEESTESEVVESEESVAEAEIIESEEATTEVAETAESTVEEEENVETTTVKSKKGLIAAIIAAAIVVALGVVYLVVSNHYSDRFFKGTMVNGVDCSGSTIDEVEAVLQKQVEEYVLTITKTDGTSEQIKGTDIGIAYVGYNQIKEAFAEQNQYLWPKSFFEDNKIQAEIVIEYEKDKLDTVISQLECMKSENQVAPVNATVIYQENQFVIQDEVYGTQLDSVKVSEAIHSSVANMVRNVSLEETGCYIQPTFKKDSAEVVAAVDEMNKYLTANITYSLDGIEVKVDAATIAPWVSVDANMVPVISNELVKQFTDSLGSKYNTSNRSGVLTTPTGKQVNIDKAGYGRIVGSDAECSQLISEIKEGKTITRAPILSQTATPEGQYLWGTTYVEVDITEQHMWYIVNGQIVFETDVVTGKKGKNDTPTGTYTILEKIKGKYLRGRLVNGKPSYITWVDYWMRVTWSGIGFHDAGWQPTFGGDRYVNNGSHGCINMPPAKAAEFYGMLEKGTHVIIHY